MGRPYLYSLKGDERRIWKKGGDERERLIESLKPRLQAQAERLGLATVEIRDGDYTAFVFGVDE